MGWYLFLAASPILLAPIVSGIYKTPIDKSDKTKKTYLIACGIILFLMIALRDKGLGSSDSTAYYNNWVKLSGMPFDSLLYSMGTSNMESGYLFSVWCLSRIFPSAQYVFVLTGLLFSVSICRTIYRNSEDSMLSMEICICLGLYTFMIQGLRQAIAMSICFFAIECCKNRKLLRFLALILLAYMFHRSSLVFLPMYFLYGFKFNVKTKIGMVMFAGVLLLLSPVLVMYGNQLMDREYFNTVDSGAVVAMFTHIIIVATAFIFLNEKNTDEDKTFFIFMTVIGMAFYTMRYIEAQAMERISFYFLIGQAIVLPTVVGKFDSTSRAIINYVVCFLSIALFIYRLDSSYGLEYMFFWEG